MLAPLLAALLASTDVSTAMPPADSAVLLAVYASTGPWRAFRPTAAVLLRALPFDLDIGVALAAPTYPLGFHVRAGPRLELYSRSRPGAPAERLVVTGALLGGYSRYTGLDAATAVGALDACYWMAPHFGLSARASGGTHVFMQNGRLALYPAVVLQVGLAF